MNFVQKVSLPLLFLLVFCPETSFATVRATFYVDPFRGSDANRGTHLQAAFQSLSKAKAAVASLDHQGSGDVVVYLRGGTYFLPESLAFGPADSGKQGAEIIYKAYDNEKPVINGGKTITGWTLHDHDRNIWQASGGPQDNFRQIYVNGNKGIRSHTDGPPVDCERTDFGFTTNDDRLQNYGHISDMELVVISKPWMEERLPVAQIVGNKITIQEPAWTGISGEHDPGYKRVERMENAYEFLREPGSWYLDKTAHILYYIPRPGENMSNATVEVPVTERLFVLNGTAQQPVTHLQFRGISFRLSNWLQPSTGRGLVQAQANQLTRENPNDPWNEKVVPGAIEGAGVRNVTISHCTFSELGGDGINLLKACRDDTIERCTFRNIAGTAIQIGPVTKEAAQLPVGAEDIVSHDVVSDCSIHDVVTEYHSGCAIFLGYVQGCQIAHNEIYNVPYTGISLGWGWTSKEWAAAYRTDNLIEGNRIHDHMEGLRDGGGVYCNGYEESGIISGNYIYNQRNFYGTIYLDDGAANWVVRGNVCRMEGGAHEWLLYKGANEQALDNYTDNPRAYGLNLIDPPSKIEGTITVANGNWPPEARAIINASGPRPESKP
jgi:hypothetical protein